MAKKRDGLAPLRGEQLGGLEPVEGQVAALVRCGVALGLDMGPGEATALVASKDDILMRTGRIDLEGDILPKLTAAFAASPWLHRDDLVPVLTELTEIFYDFRGQFDLRLTDDALIAHMRRGFDRYRGEMPLLAGRYLPDLLRAHKGLEPDSTPPDDEAVWGYFHGDN